MKQISLVVSTVPCLSHFTMAIDDGPLWFNLYFNLIVTVQEIKSLSGLAASEANQSLCSGLDGDLKLVLCSIDAQTIKMRDFQHYKTT